MSDQPMTRRARREAERAGRGMSQTSGANEGQESGDVDESRPDAQSGGTGPAPDKPSTRGPRPAPPRRARQLRGRQPGIRAAQAAVLVLLAAATLAAPILPTVGAGQGRGLGDSAPQGLTDMAAGEGASGSVADAVLGSDADLDEGSDIELATVPDAATLARIREAYTNARTTCAPRTGASGDVSAFDIAPTVFNPMLPGSYQVSSPYGYRIHPTLGYLKFHTGQDYAAPVGTPIYAVAAGTVITAGMKGETGTVTIEHELDGQTWYTTYMHMYADGIYVHDGDQVRAGQMIAGVGSTGRSTGPHLHLEVWTSREGGEENTTDPAAWLRAHQAVDLTTDCG